MSALPASANLRQASGYVSFATNGSAEVFEGMQINISHGQHPAHG
jgi:hypothetical protein